MLDPAQTIGELLPTTFLPQLPRARTTLAPLTSSTLLGTIAVLRELYIPPIHGGFKITDLNDVEDIQEVSRKARVRERRFSASLADTMDGLGLGLDLDSQTTGAGPSGRPRVDQAILEESDTREDEDDGDERDGEDGEDDHELDEEPTGHLDPFEREWAEKWLNGIVRRAQVWLEEHEDFDGADEDGWAYGDIEGVLRDATAVLAMMAGTSAAGSLTRHLLFPVHASLVSGLGAIRQAITANPSLSPTTTTFLDSLSTSPISPITPFRPISPERPRRAPGTSPERRTHTASSPPTSLPRNGQRGQRKRRGAVPLLLHDAPMMDHLSVGVQTWGSAILLGRQMALNPSHFGLFPGLSTPVHRGVRVLELGAGTGLLAILCRKLLDLRVASPAVEGEKHKGLVVATDFHKDVLANLNVCVDLNFPPHTDGAAGVTSGPEDGVKIAKLDWTTFPAYMAAGQGTKGPADSTGNDGDVYVDLEADNREIAPYVAEPFDLVLASDCVYDPTHAKMLREVAGWVLRLPDEHVEGDIGGTFHILSPIRPTFTPELESIDEHFPTLSTYVPLSERRAQTGGTSPEYEGEGLGTERRLKLGVRGEGKRSVKGRKGEGRVDEVAGYWWWEVGWG